MRIKNAKLLITAGRLDQYPPEGPLEIAFAGRSNVGKSSLINALVNRKMLARTSGQPGKTQTINFYGINNNEFTLVDLPGYGYAKVSKTSRQKWAEMIDIYFQNRLISFFFCSFYTFPISLDLAYWKVACVAVVRMVVAVGSME